MLTVQVFLEGFLTKWETSKHSVDPDDSGNYFKGALVGSKYGVTGAALAKHRNLKAVTKEDVASVTLAEAAQIARQTYYDEAQFDLLPWGPVVASAVDKCYLSGPNAAVLCLQRAVGVEADGHIGPKTVLAVARGSADKEIFAASFAYQREKHEELVIKAQPVKAKYRKGWNNRSKSYLPGTPWWKSWDLDTPNPEVKEWVGPPVILGGTPYTEQAVAMFPDANVVPPGKITSDMLAPTSPPPVPAVTYAAEPIPPAPKTTLEAVKATISGKVGNFAGIGVIATALMANPEFTAALGSFTRRLANGEGSWGLLATLLGAGLIAYRSKPNVPI